MARSRKSRYIDLARKSAKRYGIPERLFLSMIDHESGWNPAAVSHAGAIGLGQLMPGTASGLNVDPWNPVQNLDGAARYLSSQYKSFGSWGDALRAYNQGPGGARANPHNGLEYANSVLYGRRAYARVANAKGGSRYPILLGPEHAQAPKPDVDAALAYMLFSDEPEFLQYALRVLPEPSPDSSLPSYGPTSPINPTYDGQKYGVEIKGKTLVLPTSWEGTHTTDGDLRYGDWGSRTAIDILRPPGTPVGAPEDGVIFDANSSAQGGSALYFLSDSGWMYWIGHIDNKLPEGTRVRRGEPVAFVSADHPTPHVHMDRKRYRRRER